MQRQEKRRGFAEKSRHGSAFFRQGKTDQWRDELAAEQIDRMIEAHGEVMADFGYLP